MMTLTWLFTLSLDKEKSVNGGRAILNECVALTKRREPRDSTVGGDTDGLLFSLLPSVALHYTTGLTARRSMTPPAMPEPFHSKSRKSWYSYRDSQTSHAAPIRKVIHHICGTRKPITP